jgi:hypothetical protein
MNSDDLFAALGDSLDDAPEHAHKARFDSPIAARIYMTGGKATVTLVSLRTNVRFTYQIGVSKDGQCHFVSVLVGADNNSDYKYLGRISRDMFWQGRKVPKPGDISADAPSAKAFAWVWRQLAQNVLPDQLEIWHEGSCGRCGRRLTVPTSIKSGFGPECIGKI